MEWSRWIARRCGVVAVVGVVLVLGGSAFARAGEPEARARLRKEGAVEVDWRHRDDVIAVKFLDDVGIRAVDGALVEVGADGVLAAARAAEALVDAGSWRAAHSVEPARLQALRRRAEVNLGRAIADPRSEFLYWLPAGVSAGEAIAAFNALDVVELASPVQVATPSPRAGEGPSEGSGGGEPMVANPPNFQGAQGYLNASPTGIGAVQAWLLKGVRGAGVRVADIEYDFNANHADLPGVTVLTLGTPTPPFDNNHGTAVLGQMGSVNNGWGTTGIAHEADFYFSHQTVNGVTNIASAIYRCVDAFDAGDVILIEAQVWGPNSINFPPDCSGCVPVEWLFSNYTAIVIAVGNGIHVVEAGANGQENLDDPVYTQGNGGHWPFRAGADSGAIIVGAGHAPSNFGGNGVARSRMWYSNYGARLNLQGWGQAVWTTGYGSAFALLGQNYWYTSSFGGTSSASPIVAGAVALLESYHQSALGEPMDPFALRELLVQTGAAQTNGQFPATQKIGPLPNVYAAIEAVPVPEPCPGDLDANGVVDAADLGIMLSSFGMSGGDLVADLDGSGVVDAADLGMLLSAFGQSCD